MASFPTTVKTFASRNNGQTIDAAHVGDLQDEVNAIEDGLLSATAQLNLNSTIKLGQTYIFPTAAAASTGQTLTVETISGSTHTLKWDSVSAVPDAVRLALNANFGLANNSSAAVQWSTAHFATNSSLHSTTTSPERMTPQSTGIYAVAVNLTLINNYTDNSSVRVQVTVEDSSGGIVAFQNNHMVTPWIGSASLFGLKRFDSVSGSTQWLRVVVLQVSGSTNSIDSARTFCHFYKL